MLLGLFMIYKQYRKLVAITVYANKSMHARTMSYMHTQSKTLCNKTNYVATKLYVATYLHTYIYTLFGKPDYDSNSEFIS